MSTVHHPIGRLLAAVGGAMLIASLFMSSWDPPDALDAAIAITGACGIVAALTGGWFGFFRADVSFNGVTDMYGVLLGTALTWAVLFDDLGGAGAYVALAGAWVQATGAGDFRPSSLFGRMDSRGERRRT